MAQLVQSFAGDTALRLQNEEYVRKMSFGYNWNRMNVSFNISAPQFNGTIADTGGFYIGLCEGTTNTLKSSTCAEWVGIYVSGSGWNYTAGPPAGINIAGGAGNFQRGYKIGNTLTQSGVDSVGCYIGVTNRHTWYITIEQSATGYNIFPFIPSAVPTLDLFGRNFELLINQSEEATVRAINFATNRKLDSVNIYWAIPTVGLEISEVLVTRLA